MDIKGHWTWYLRHAVFGGSLGLKAKMVFGFPRWWVLGTILLLGILDRQVVILIAKIPLKQMN